MSSKLEQKILGQNVDITLLSSNLRWLMENKPIDSAGLSEKTGIAVTTLNSLKRSVGNPTYSTLVTLGNFFNVTVSQLTEINLSNNSTLDQKSHDIPLLTFNDLSSYLFNHKKATDYISVGIDQDAQNCFAIKITTNSMAPFFEKGSVFVLNTAMPPQDGDIVLVQFSSNHPCFRKVFIEGISYFFKPVAESLVDTNSKNEKYTIHGVVITAIQNFHSN
jgi:transcriptional regulator with XRE-family HTH domain